MQTLNLKIDDTFFPHFKAILDSFVKDKKIEIISEQSFTVNSIEEVKRRVFEAEAEPSLSSEEYTAKNRRFLQKVKLGTTR